MCDQDQLLGCRREQRGSDLSTSLADTPSLVVEVSLDQTLDEIEEKSFSARGLDRASHIDRERNLTRGYEYQQFLVGRFWPGG